MKNKKINLALISPNKNAYSETFIQNHKKLLDANIFYLYHETLPERSEDKDLYIKYTFLNKLRRKLSKIFFPQLLNFHEKKIAAYFKKHHIEVVLAEFGMTGAALLKICSKLKIPLIVHFHGVDAYLKEILSKNNRYKSLFEQAAFVVAVSTDMYNKLFELGCLKNKLVLDPYGPSEIFFTSRPRYDSHSFISVGRFVEKKSPQTTIMAFSRVVKQYPDAVLKMIGEGPLLSKCKKLADDLKLNENIEFLGVQPPQKVLMFYQESIAFVQHSVTAKDGDAEGTPVAILEASAAALPVISTFHGGISDAVINGCTGLLCAEHDVEQMANNMIQILQNPSAAALLGKQGRVWIKDNFSLDKHISILNGIIQKAII